MSRVFGSIRAKATLGATLVVAVALVAAGVAVLLSLRGNLSDRADADADNAARQVASQLAARTPYKDLDLPDGEDHPVQVVDEDDRVLAASEDLEAIHGTGASAVRPVPAPGADRDDDEDDAPGPGELGEVTRHTTGRATVDGDEAAYRFAEVEVDDLRDETVRVYAGAPLEAQRSAVGTAATAMLIGFPLLLLVVAGTTWLVTRRALRPVEGIRAEMAAITASEDLSRRVPEPDAHDEVARLARTTNETLTALEASVERQRRFVADASHELRSPIASLRTQLEVGAAHPELLDVPGAVADTVRLQQLAADLLLLARLDAGERPGEARLDLAAFVREEVSQRAGDRVPVAVRAVDEGLELAGSRSQLGRVLGNLLDNAQRHARSRITVEAHAEGGVAVLAVADDGDGVPDAERERIFQRFVRLDDARSRDDGGAGLGLAIARDVAERHGGRLTVGRSPEGGALFRVELPLGG
ncbi:HAMP domain-containing sensor histidine kinase [Streptomyces sp. B-S-A8]|uniref:histidine kinase n=1 Tax=Streptomyces solicavernae TaxID=3043614 RepID=A0ABT6RNN9_9ACTN|nr:HAMP domain-containing sensor histidine kinase [Streptomyces sp. B-S-A8]MDI3386041.1 HAMP domain-containing sensor histidine kinase [Streptomyces sp. B-S-A8]